MRHSLAAFLVFLVVGLTIVALETLFVVARFDQYQGQIVQNSEMTLEHRAAGDGAAKVQAQ